MQRHAVRISILFLALILLPGVLAFQAELDKYVYLTNSTLTISGSSLANVTINATIYDATSEVAHNGTNSSTSGTFSITVQLTSYDEGNYYATVTENNNETLTLYFKVRLEEVNYPIYMITNATPIVINTTSDNTADERFSDLPSISGTIYYGNATLGEVLYTFVLVDDSVNLTYTSVYLDDDQTFELYNNTEDFTGITESNYQKRDIFAANGTNYVIAGMNVSGGRLLLAVPSETSSYGVGETAYYMIVTEDADGSLEENEALSISITGPVSSNETNTTNDYGYYTSSVALTIAGFYIINVNDGLSTMLIEASAYTLSVKTTDLSGDPQTSYTPGDTVRIEAVIKNSTTSLNATMINCTITFPNGTQEAHDMTATSTGNYYYDFTTPADLEGSYGVRVASLVEGVSQSKSIGFVAESTAFNMFAINTNYLDQVQGGGAFVSAFAPGANITIMAIRVNISKGGYMAEDGMIDIENPSAGIYCEDVVSVTLVKDDKGTVYSVDTLNLNITSLQDLVDTDFFPAEVTPPAAMMRQCMIIIRNTSLPKGFYTIQGMLDLGTEKQAGTSFSIQRLLADAYTVDKNGNEFGFFSPGTTVYMKITLTDMLTDLALNDSQIKEVTISQVEKNGVLYTVTNESYDNTTATLRFTSPAYEGFYSLRFRFKAMIDGANHTGEGQAFFQLKKYIIFAQVAQGEGDMGPGFKKPGDNITLTVTIVDIEKGGLFEIGMSGGTAMSCTGCEGLNARVTRIFNDQLFQEVDDSAYTATEGSVTSSTSGATIIIQQDTTFDTGWYMLDIELYNPEDESEVYTGFGFFEIRNFFVPMLDMEYNATNNSFSSDSSEEWTSEGEFTFETGSNAYLKVLAMRPGPNGGVSLNITNATIINVLKEGYDGPPIPVDYQGGISERFVRSQVCSGPGNCTYEMSTKWIANISGLSEEGFYMANIRVTTDSGSDIGSADIIIAAFQLAADYRGDDSWDPIFASDENLTITYSATTFDDQMHNLDAAVLQYVWSGKEGKPQRVTEEDWSCPCAGHECVCNVRLSDFEEGWYEFQFKVNDTEGNSQTSLIEIRIKDYLFSLPQILEVFNWNSDTGDTGSIEVRESEDRCDNSNLWLQWDNMNYLANSNYLFINETERNITAYFKADACEDEVNKTCFIDGSYEFNFTDYQEFDKGPATVGVLMYCMNESSARNTTLDNCFPDLQEGFVPIGIMTNLTHTWVKYNINNDTDGRNYSMSGANISTTAGDTIYLGSDTWTSMGIPAGDPPQWNYTDSRIIHYQHGWQGSYYDIDEYLHVTDKPEGFKVGGFCEIESGSVFIENMPPNSACTHGVTMYAVMNTTHSMLSYNTNMTGSWVTQGIQEHTSSNWSVIDTGYNNGGTAGNYTRVIDADYYGKFIPMGQDMDIADYIIPPAYSRTMRGTFFCVQNDSEINNQPRQWYQRGGSQCDQGIEAETVYTFSNGTHLWVGSGDNDLSDNTAIKAGETFSGVVNQTWELVSLNVSSYQSEFRVRLADNYICGETWNCEEGECTKSLYELIRPQTDTNFGFGYINLVQSPWMVDYQYTAFNSSRYVYLYHNRTHLWLTEDGNFSGHNGTAIGRNISDPYGGSWYVKQLSDSSISLRGNTRLASTGGIFNLTVYSKSGTVRIGTMREVEFGFFKMNEGGRSGIDLNGDGLTNGTMYYILSDNSTAGVYDTFFFSSNSTFNAPISVNANKATRTFVGGNDTLTLLSIDPRADRVRFYSSDTGDWSDLGDIAVSGNIRIPFLVMKPNGSTVAATVTAKGVYTYNDEGAKEYRAFDTEVSASSSSGELLLNSGTTGGAFDTGINLFEIVANTSEGNLSIEEWRWPRANLQAFLVTNYLGRGGWIEGFAPIDIDVFSEQTGTRTLEVFTANLSQQYQGTGAYYGVVEDGWDDNVSACNLVRPLGIDPDPDEEIHQSRWRLRNPNYFFYYSGDGADGEKVWIKAGDCNYTDIPSYEVGDPINVTSDGKTYFLEVLAIRASTGPNNRSFALIGVNITNTTLMKPTQIDHMNNGLRWALASINISNQTVNVLYVNATENPMCAVYGGWEYLTGAFLTTNGDYSGTALVAGSDIPGFTNKYIAGIGPNRWEGIMIGNNSAITRNFAFGNMRFADNTLVYVKDLNETIQNMDLNIDGDKSDNFTIVVYDELSDGTQTLNRVTTDDDLEITPNWQSWGSESAYYDYSGTETGIAEQWGSLPNAIWSGNVEFGPSQENETYRQLDWEQRSVYNVILFNNTAMLLSKEAWCGIPDEETIKVISRAYHFNQTSIQGANTTISKIFKLGFSGGGAYDPSLYTITNGTTDNNGYAVASASPVGSWETDSGGEYLFRLFVTSPQGVSSTEHSFVRIGGECTW